MTDYTTQQLTEARREIRHAAKYPPFDEDQAYAVVQAVQAGNLVSDVVKWPGYVSRRVLTLWRSTNPDFDADLIAAMEERADAMAERALTVASDKDRDPACRRIEVDVCKWYAGKLSARYSPKGAEGATVVNNTQVNVQGDLNMTPSEAYLQMIKGDK